MLVTNHLATYKELRDEYSLKEVLDLYEIAMVHSYNESVIVKKMKGGSKKE